MRSVSPVLEQIFNQDLIIPGIEGITSINSNFFFIIFQNDASKNERYELPDKINKKLRKIIYPEQSKEEIETIYSFMNNSLYEEHQKYKLEDLEARKCGDFMISLNQNNLTPHLWSLRDINKIFLRIKNQKYNNEYFKNVGTDINLLFYSLSSIAMAQLNKDNVDKIIKLLKFIFNEIIDEDDLQKVLFNPATL